MFKKDNTKTSEKQRREKKWKIILTDNYWLWHPRYYRPIERWYKWAEMQTKILSKLQSNFPDTHTYIRFSTFLPEHYKEITESERIEKIIITNKDETVIFFPDCQDQNIWKRLLEGAGLISYARCIFMLKDKPINWMEIVMSLFEIIKKLDKDHSINEYKSKLSICPCLCYSLDEDLVIGKVDLPENIVLDILKDVAQEHGLELVIERKP